MLVKRNMSKTSVLYVAVLSVCIVFIFCELYISYILTSVVPLQNIGHALTTKNELADFNRINENFTFENGRFQPEIGSFNSAEVEGPNFSNSFTAYKPKRILFVNMEDITKTFRNIFFVETRCSTEKTLEGYVHNKGFVLSARQSCAIESTALTNPDREIYVFHSCPLDDDFLHHSPHFVPQLFSYPNVHLVKLNNTQLFNGSPVQQLYEKKLLESSSYPVEHSSDVIRFTLLWKFGGTYFDLDIVTLRSLKRLRSNWVGAESEWVIGTGVMNFKHVGSAHGMLQRILHHINYHYDKDGWASNGPLLLTSFIIRECKVLQVEDAANRCFTDFTVYRRHVLYPIRTSQLHLLFNSTLGLQTVRMVKTVSYSVHVWNKKSRNLSVDVGSAQGYALLADQFCPRVYRNCGTRF